MNSVADFQSLESRLFSSTTGVLQKDISATKSMPFWSIEEVPVQTVLRDGAHKFNKTKTWFTSAFKLRAKYSHINL